MKRARKAAKKTRPQLEMEQAVARYGQLMSDAREGFDNRRERSAMERSRSKPPRKANPETAIVADVMKALHAMGLFAWRQNTLPVPIRSGSRVTGFRPALKRGISDILGIIQIPSYLPRELAFTSSGTAKINNGEFSNGYIKVHLGVLLAVEVKQPKAKLSEYQEQFRDEVVANGGVYIVAHSAAEAIELLKPYINGDAVPTATY
jgi:hypothetical protein